MLEHLYIKNFTIIDELDIPFYPGFSVITGETGAGKSIILGAIGLLLGQRADTRMIKSGAKKCTIEAHFHMSDSELDKFFEDNDIDNDDTCILRRELLDSGKSRAFINDTPVSLALIKELGEHLVDVHSQHQNLLLQQDDFQMHVVDIVADNGNIRKKYQDKYQQLQDARKELAGIMENLAKNKENEDFLRFQLQELVNARLVEGMQDELEQEQEMLTHAEDIKGTLMQLTELLDGEEHDIQSQIRQVCNLTQSIEDVYPAMTPLLERLESVKIEVQDIASEISSLSDNVEVNPQRLQMVSDQLDTIYSLEQKHHVTTVEELIGIRSQLETQVNAIDNSDLTLEDLEKKVKILQSECANIAQDLTKTRQKAAKTIEGELQKRLVPLGIPNVRFQVCITERHDADAIKLTPMGADIIQFLFSANKNAPLRPVSEVASGGEIARVMLSVKAMVSGMVKLPTIIFDEIDTGISGKIAQQMAFIMKQMGEQERQVISITHLPQIAAAGSTHYKVYKEDSADTTTSHMKLLGNEERVMEIAQMMSGDNISEAAINNAQELLGI